VSDLPRLEAVARRRPQGSLGIRHRLLVVPSVVCAAQAAHGIAEGAPDAQAIEHQHGCSQLGGDARLTEHVLTGLGTHPNVAGTLVVGLGCETVQGMVLYRAIAARGQRAEFVGIQQAGGTQAAVRAGRDALERLRQASAADPEVPVSWADLTVGIEGGWLSLPPAQSRVFAEVLEALLGAGAVVIQAVPRPSAPGLGAGPGEVPSASVDLPAGDAERLVARSFPARSWEVAPYAGPLPPARGFVLMPSPEARVAQKTGLAAAGAHLILSPLTGGLPAGSPVAPVVHVGIAPYARAFADDVEAVLGEDPPPGAAGAILRALASACREETVAEVLGMTEMAIHRIAPTM
jgi:altronate dehydratase large subunit